MNWTYIGDGVYARFDGYQVWICTKFDGIQSPIDQIALEPTVLTSLVDYYKKQIGI